MNMINDEINIKKVIKLPKIICGRIIYQKEGDEVITLKYENGVTVEMPSVTEEDVQAIISNREKLFDIPLSEVTDYLGNAGKKMVDDKYELKREAMDLGAEVSGYSVPMFQRDYFIIGNYIGGRYHLYDLLDAEFGTHHIVDEWVRNQVGRIRAYPRGRALHIMVGNVPLASMFSIVRSILTKNQTLVKIPARDPITSIYMAMILIKENGENHPLSRSISAFYLDKKSEYLEYLKKSSDVICAWGKGSALESVKKTIPHSIPYLEFGPKRSFAVLFTEGANLETAALRMAHDMSIYDQEACFSPQRLFIVGEYEKFLEYFKKYLDVSAEYLPKGRTNMDAQSYLNRIKMESKYRGWDMHEGKDWTIVIADPYKVKDHPLGRTMFIHPIESLDEIIPFVDDETQGITVYPYNRSQEVADRLCPYGVQRICEMGMVSYPRAGFTHDGMYPLHYFVRLANWDEGLNYVNSYHDREGNINYLHYTYGKPNIENFGDVVLRDKE